MFIRVERGSSIPISRQIGEQIRAQCLAGTLKPGDSLPAVRRLAQQLAVNVNTVLRVYERLAAEKLIEMRHGDGTYVLPNSTRAEATRLMADQRDQYTRELGAGPAGFAVGAQAAGASPPGDVGHRRGPFRHR